MAITWLEKDIEWGSNPSFMRSVGYEETKRTATSVTYNITLKLKVEGSGASSSYYGYNISWALDGGSATTIKDSGRWYGNEAYRTFTKTITKTVTASGGTTSFSLKITGGHGSSGSPNLSKTYSPKVSTFNTAPTWSSSARLVARENSSSGAIITNEIDGSENAKKIAENISKIYLSWDSASDNENNISKYHLYAQIDDGSWSNIYSGTARNYTHSIGSGNQGRKYDYYVKAEDSHGELSPSLDLRQFQKNTMTGASPSVSSSIGHDTSSIKVTWSGASNTNGNSSFTYSVSSSDITIYNKESLTSSGGTISILKSGTSSSPYILFEDLKKLVRGSSSKTGSFTISLTTKNAYGSSTSKTVKVSVDLRTNPKAPTTVTIGGKVSTSLGSFLIPSRSNMTVSWSGASDPLGGALSYKVIYTVGSGSAVTVDAGTSTSTTIKLPTPSSATTISVKVQVVTTYGKTATSSSVSDTLHYYNPPTVSLSGYSRTMTGMSIDINCALNSSLPNIAFSKRSFTGNGTSGTFTTTKHTATIGDLTESSAFTFTATVNDNTGLSGDVSASHKVTPAIPMLSIREKGVGINCVNDSEYRLKVSGSSHLVGYTKVDDVLDVKDLSIATGDWDCYLYNYRSGKSLQLKHDGRLTYHDQEIYHTGNKPTPADIGASASNHSHSNYASSSHTHSDYASKSHTHDYLPLSGGSLSGTLDVTGNINSTASINIGSYEDTFRSVVIKRKVNSTNYSARFGVSSTTIDLTSSSGSSTAMGGVIESYFDGSAQARYLFTNTATYPGTDNKFYNGVSSRRWKAIYATSGSVYSSSADEKKDIVPINEKVKRNVDPTVKTIVEGIKDLDLYQYKYRTLGDNDIFVGFLGQELEEKNPEFFNLIGSSYTREDGSLQYDIRDTSMIGVLTAGLKEALLEIDNLKARIEELEKGE